MYKYSENIFRATFSSLNSVPTHYDVLKINASATSTEIKDAYIRGCKECHPDISNSPEASEQFRQVREAYRVLSNPNTKMSYDYQIGYVLQNNTYDDDIEIKSAKRGRAPKDSVAERVVMQRYISVYFGCDPWNLLGLKILR